MATRTSRLRLWRGLALAIAMGAAMAQTAPSPQLQRDRMDMLRGLATEPLELTSRVRQQCAAGQQPAAIARSRALGAQELPDAADYCAAALHIVGRAGQLLQLYRELQAELSGAATGAEQLPSAIAAVVVKTKGNQVSIGNGRAAVVTPALALDAGFTVAFTKGAPPAAGMPDLTVLKPIAERCLAQAEANLGLCYSVGHVYGARAIAALPLTAP